MKIYIEDFLLQNTIINLCLLRLVQITTKNKTTFFKMLIASIVGAGFSVISASCLTNSVIINLLKIACACVMIKICFKSNFKNFVANFLLLFGFTLALCGFVLATQSNAQFTSFGIATTNINLWLVMLMSLIFSYIFEKIAKHIKLKINLNNLVYKVKLTNEKQTLSINAFLDTGNMLTIDGKPVMILDLSSYLKLTNKTYIDYVLNPPNSPNLSLNTVAGAANLKLVTLSKMQISLNGKIKEISSPIVAINSSNKFNSTNYQALISPAFF